MKRRILTQLIASCFGPVIILAGSVSSSYSAQPRSGTPVNYKVALIGDQGLGSNARAVLTLIQSEGADAVVHLGDFDYTDNPAAWDAQITAILGEDFPYFACVGNHDEAKFYGAGGYQVFMEARMNRLGIPWDGDLGVKSSHTYNGIFFVLTGPGVLGTGHSNYIRDRLAVDSSIWSISGWHKNMRAMQVGGKTDETGWGVYEESRKGGAIIATGHEHSYSRTHLLSSCQNQTVASTSDPLMLTQDLPGTGIDEGKTFAFVTGLGGHSIRDQQLSGAWWASIYTSTQGANYGALFGTFNVNGDPKSATFYFKDIDGTIADSFTVKSALTSSFDTDGDGVPDSLDNCPTVFDPTQTDSDGDGLGDVCDNCPADFNPGQEDDDNNGWGDACTCPIVNTGDVNLSGTLTSADLIGLVNYVFKSGATPMPCQAAGDVDCSGTISAADIIYMVNYVFTGGPPPCDACTSSLAPGC